MSSVNKFKDSLKSKKANPAEGTKPIIEANNIDDKNVISNPINDNAINNINDSVLINNDNSKAIKSVLAEVLDDIPEGQEVKKIVSFSLSPVIIKAIEKVSKERKVAKSKLVENILSKVLIEEK